MYNNILYDTRVCWREKNRSRTLGTCIIIVYTRTNSGTEGHRTLEDDVYRGWGSVGEKKISVLYDTIRKRSPTPRVLHTLQV